MAKYRLRKRLNRLAFLMTMRALETQIEHLRRINGARTRPANPV